MRNLHLAGAVLALAILAAVVAGSAGPARSSIATDPANWKRCTTATHGFSVAYPGSWHIASYDRLHVLGKGDAYRRQFLRNNICLNFDPKPFTVHDGTEGPQTAVMANRIPGANAFHREQRAMFTQQFVRTIDRTAVTIGGHRAIRFHVYRRPGAPLWDRAHVYGYLIDLGTRGAGVIEAWRYHHKPISVQQFRSNMAVVDRMAPTMRAPR